MPLFLFLLLCNVFRRTKEAELCAFRLEISTLTCQLSLLTRTLVQERKMIHHCPVASFLFIKYKEIVSCFFLQGFSKLSLTCPLVDADIDTDIDLDHKNERKLQLDTFRFTDKTTLISFQSQL
jgi:hypothetical protein